MRPEAQTSRQLLRQLAPEVRVLRRDGREVGLGDTGDDRPLHRENAGAAGRSGFDEGHLAHVLARLPDGQFAPVDADGDPAGEDEVDFIARAALGDELLVWL